MTSVTQMEYVIYTRYLDEVKIIEESCRNGNYSDIGFIEGRFVNLSKIKHSKSSHVKQPINQQTFVATLIKSEQLKSKITFINDVHRKLKAGNLKNRKCDDCAPLAADFYNKTLEIIVTWNNTFSPLQIVLPTKQGIELAPSFSNKTLAQVEDENALTRYFELLKKYPKLMDLGKLNGFKKGTYKIIVEQDEIDEIRPEVYQCFFAKAKSQGLTDSEADDLATTNSRPGIVCEDNSWIWIRDFVVTPQGFKYTYNRRVMKRDLDKVATASNLPIERDNNISKTSSCS